MKPNRCLICGEEPYVEPDEDCTIMVCCGDSDCDNRWFANREEAVATEEEMREAISSWNLHNPALPKVGDKLYFKRKEGGITLEIVDEISVISSSHNNYGHGHRTVVGEILHQGALEAEYRAQETARLAEDVAKALKAQEDFLNE